LRNLQSDDFVGAPFFDDILSKSFLMHPYTQLEIQPIFHHELLLRHHHKD